MAGKSTEKPIRNRRLPKVTGHWLYGNLLDIRKDFLGFVHQSRLSHGDLFMLNTWGPRVAIMTDPDAARHMLQTDHRRYIKSRGYEVLGRLMGQGLLTSEGDFWLRQRRLAQPAFHREKLAAITTDMSQICIRYIDRWERYYQAETEFDVALEMNRLALEIVTQALFSTSIGDNLDRIHQPVSLLNDFGIKAMTNPILLFARWLMPKTYREFTDALAEVDAVIYEIIEGRMGKPSDHYDLLSMLLTAEDAETGEKMNKTQVRDEVVTMFMAGHETSANALAWTWYLLAKHPEVATRLREEWDEVLEGRPATFEDLPQLVYTRQVIQESLRLYPPAWMVGRRSRKEVEIGGYRVPANTNILLSVYEIHRHPDWWEEPEAFRPERFEAGAESKMHKFQYFPFGGGPRMCIGYHFAMMEMQIVLASLGQKFELSLVQALEPEPEALVTLRPKGGIRMKISAIKSQRLTSKP